MGILDKLFGVREEPRMTRDEALRYLIGWRPYLDKFLDFPPSLHDIKRAADLVEEHGYHPILALAYMDAGARAVAVHGDRHAYNEREGRKIVERWHTRIEEYLAQKEAQRDQPFQLKP